MNDFLADFAVILVIGLVGLSMYLDYSLKAQAAEPVKAEPVETLVPTHTAKCTETKGSTCITYTIYRITNP